MKLIVDAERLFDAVENPAVLLLIETFAKLCRLGYEFALLGIESSRHHDLQVTEQISPSTRVQARHSATPQPNHVTGLAACLDPHFFIVSKQILNRHGFTEHGLEGGHPNLVVKICSLPDEGLMLAHREHDEQIPRRPVALSRIAFPGKPEPHPVVHAGGNGDLEVGLTFHPTRPAAVGTRAAVDTASTAACGAGLCHREKSSLKQHLSVASARAAGLR